MALAEKFGLVEFPSPGGGCLLTDPGFSVRLKELITRNPDATALDIERLKVGRHFRSPGGTKIVVGRHQADNEILAGLVGSGDFSLNVNDYPGPLTLVEESATGEDLQLAASITVRYSKASEKKRPMSMLRDRMAGRRQLPWHRRMTKPLRGVELPDDQKSPRTGRCIPMIRWMSLWTVSWTCTCFNPERSSVSWKNIFMSVGKRVSLR